MQGAGTQYAATLCLQGVAGGDEKGSAAGRQGAAGHSQPGSDTDMSQDEVVLPMGRLDWAAQQEAAAGRQVPGRLSLDQRLGTANGHHPSAGEGGAAHRGPRHRCRAAVCHGNGVVMCAALPQAAGMSMIICRKGVARARRCKAAFQARCKGLPC